MGSEGLVCSCELCSVGGGPYVCSRLKVYIRWEIITNNIDVMNFSHSYLLFGIICNKDPIIGKT